MESLKIGIEKFDGSDFGFWKMQIEDYLYQKDLHEPLLGVMPDTMTTEQWKLKEWQALGLIRLTLSRYVAFNIIKEKTTSDLLKAADTQKTSKTVGEEPAVEQVTPESLLRRSSSAIRVPDMYVPSLHYLLLTLMKGN